MRCRGRGDDDTLNLFITPAGSASRSISTGTGADCNRNLSFQLRPVRKRGDVKRGCASTIARA